MILSGLNSCDIQNHAALVIFFTDYPQVVQLPRPSGRVPEQKHVGWLISVG